MRYVKALFTLEDNLYMSLLSPLDLFKEWPESECIGFALTNRISCPMTGPMTGSREFLFHFCPVRRQQKATSCGTGKEPWADNAFAGSLIFYCPASRTVSNKFPFHVGELKHLTIPKQTMTHISTRSWTHGECRLCVVHCNRNEFGWVDDNGILT